MRGLGTHFWPLTGPKNENFDFRNFHFGNWSFFDHFLGRFLMGTIPGLVRGLSGPGLVFWASQEL